MGIPRQRELEAKQRAMERKIRKLKRFAEGTLDPEAAKEYRRKLRQAQHELKVFVEEHSDVLKRDYSREKYYGKDLTNERNKRILKEKIANGELTLTLNPDKQNPHILGTEEYDETRHKSYFDISQEELQEFVNNNYATGEIKVKENGQIKETLEFENDVGVVVDKDGVVIGRTNRATIHYSKKRTHIVPTRKKVAEINET